MSSLIARFLTGLLVIACLPTFANEVVIRKSFAERMPNAPKIDEVRPSPMPGLWEVRIGNEVRYTDPTGSFLIEGELIDVKAKKSLTQERVAQLNRVNFASLPLKDALMWKNGNGKRRFVVFADPNCGYCKHFERSLQELKDVTVYTFLIPILGGDSPEKTRAIWCAKDATATWLAWMLKGEQPPKAPANCDDAAIERNLALSRKIYVNATPAIVLEDGNRISGAVGAVELEKRLQTLVVPGRKS